MEMALAVNIANLCEGCVSLNLDTGLISQIDKNGPFFQNNPLTLSPDHCSLCSLIISRLQEQGLSANVALGLSAHETAEKKIDDERKDIVRRLEVHLKSSPRVKIVRFWPCVYPTPSVRDIGDASEVPDVPFPSGRTIEPFVNIQLFKRWRQLCREYHGDKCTLPPWAIRNDSVPSSFRLINLHASCIIEAPAKPSYFALSYVWGPFSQTDLCATSTNIDELRKEHSLKTAALPQTILDVMKLVSELGGRYLWVDRLCILQDDDNDKALQIPHMDSIYSLAELTIIAASGSGAHDGVAGLSVPRSIKQDICRIGDKSALMTIPTENNFPNYTYSQRGWTFQERLLARRSLMFTDAQAYWSCCSADWTERIILEPSKPRPASNPWTIPRIHLGSYEPVAGEYYRDFSRQHYNNLPRFYALKDFTSESDAMDAISGLLSRITLVTGDGFYWGHILGGLFDQSLSWRRTRMQLERRTALCPIRGAGTKYEVSFPSWSWLGWKTAIKFVLDLQLNAFPNVRLNPEIGFFHLDLDGRIKSLVPDTEAQSGVVDNSLLDVSGTWKGEVPVITDNFPKDKPFRDSGRLLFWTSHAELLIKAENRVHMGCVYMKIVSPAGETVGRISEVTLASDHHAAWPFARFDETVLQSFIVISRKYRIDKKQGEQVLIAEPKLKVMWIQWQDEERKVASRISVGEVDELTWINVKRDWRVVILG
jgi:hypothetical protein